MSRKKANFAVRYGGLREREIKAIATLGIKTGATKRTLLDSYPLANYAQMQDGKNGEVKDLFAVVAYALTLLNARLTTKAHFELTLMR